jgi:hypothetical protein
MLRLLILSPVLERQSRKLGSIFGEDAAGAAAELGNVVEHPRDLWAGQGDVRIDPEAFPRVVVMHGEEPKSAAVGETVMDEILPPALIWPLWRRRTLGTAHEALLAPTALANL